jgi:pimeloyl-ACP methyl ester carboxylesterase
MEPIVVAAHPADEFGDRAVALLEETAGVRAVCVNPRSLTLEAMVDEIEDERRHLGIERWFFWGISGGGWLGQIYARNCPRALAGVILESICPCFRVRLADPACVLSPFHASWQLRLAERGLIADDSHDEVGDAKATEWIGVDGVGEVFRRINGPALFVSPFPVTDALRRVTPQLWSFDARPWLAEIDTRALILCGDADPLVPAAHARALHEGIRGSQLVVLEGAGHSPVMSRRPDLIAAVRAFIDR